LNPYLYCWRMKGIRKSVSSLIKRCLPKRCLPKRCLPKRWRKHVLKH
jgi:hypothetical protein